MESLPVLKVVKGDDTLHDLYMACVTRITLWNWALYSKTATKITNNFSSLRRNRNCNCNHNLKQIFGVRGLTDSVTNLEVLCSRPFLVIYATNDCPTRWVSNLVHSCIWNLNSHQCHHQHKENYRSLYQFHGFLAMQSR